MNRSGVEEDCLLQLKSAPASVNASGMITLYPGETVELQVTIFDDWHRDVTKESTIDVEVISGHAYINHAGQKSITLSPSHPRYITLLADCLNGYSDQCSVISAGPPQFSGLIKICFHSCETTSLSGSSCSSSVGCVQLLDSDIDCGDNFSDCSICSCPFTSTISVIQPAMCLLFQRI